MASYSYWNEYQRALKEIKRLEEEKEQMANELRLLAAQPVALASDNNNEQTIKIMQLRQELEQERDKVSALEEKVYQLQQALDASRNKVHTSVINAINLAFDEY